TVAVRSSPDAAVVSAAAIASVSIVVPGAPPSITGAPSRNTKCASSAAVSRSFVRSTTACTSAAPSNVRESTPSVAGNEAAAASASGGSSGDWPPTETTTGADTTFCACASAASVSSCVIAGSTGSVGSSTGPSVTSQLDVMTPGTSSATSAEPSAAGVLVGAPSTNCTVPSTGAISRLPRSVSTCASSAASSTVTTGASSFPPNRCCHRRAGLIENAVSSSAVAAASKVSPAVAGSSVVLASPAASVTGSAARGPSSASRRSCAAVRVRPPTSTPATLVPLGNLSEKNHCAPVYRPPRTSTPTPVHSRPRTQPRRGASSSKPSNGDSWRDSSGGTGPNGPGGSATEPTTGADAAAGCAGAPCAGSAGVAADAGVAVVGASVAGVGRIDVRTTGSGRVHGATGGITCVASEAPCSPAGGSAGDDPAGPDA